MKLNNKIASKVSAEAKAALEAGKGKRTIGAQSGAKVGEEFILNSIEFNSRFVRPDAISRDDWNAMSDAERAEKGRKIEFFSFDTNQGDLSVSALLQPHDDVTTWEETLNDHDVNGANVFKPSTRKVETFINSDECANLLDGHHKLLCIATAETQNANQTFATRHKLFEVVQF